MCRDPVTLGGGIIIEKLCAFFFALAPAAKHLLASQADRIAASDIFELKFFSILIQTTIAYSSTTYRWINLNKSLMMIKSIIIYKKSQHFIAILKLNRKIIMN
jgi:hypothetical protein